MSEIVKAVDVVLADLKEVLTDQDTRNSLRGKWVVLFEGVDSEALEHAKKAATDLRDQRSDIVKANFQLEAEKRELTSRLSAAMTENAEMARKLLELPAVVALQRELAQLKHQRSSLVTESATKDLQLAQLQSQVDEAQVEVNAQLAEENKKLQARCDELESPESLNSSAKRMADGVEKIVGLLTDKR